MRGVAPAGASRRTASGVRYASYRSGDQPDVLGENAELCIFMIEAGDLNEAIQTRGELTDYRLAHSSRADLFAVLAGWSELEHAISLWDGWRLTDQR